MSFDLTTLGLVLTFVVFVFFVMKTVWPVIAKGLQERKAVNANDVKSDTQEQHSLKKAIDNKVQL